MRYVIARTLADAKMLEADPRACGACMLFETFTRPQRVVAWFLWRTPLLRWVFRPFIFRFLNPYATLVFALGTPPKPKPPESPETQVQIPNGDASNG